MKGSPDPKDPPPPGSVPVQNGAETFGKPPSKYQSSFSMRNTSAKGQVVL